jgi:hypothetical protein
MYYNVQHKKEYEEREKEKWTDDRAGKGSGGIHQSVLDSLSIISQHKIWLPDDNAFLALYCLIVRDYVPNNF